VYRRAAATSDEGLGRRAGEDYRQRKSRLRRSSDPMARPSWIRLASSARYWTRSGPSSPGRDQPRPAGLTDREAQVIALVARGLQTKQIGHRLGISTKTADRHLQNAYAKIGVSTRAAATMFAMQHGLTSWGELPIPDLARRF